MEPEGSLPCSQEPSTGPYAESNESSSYRLSLFLFWLQVVSVFLFLNQVSFLRVTREHLALSIRRRCSMYAAHSLLLGLALTYFSSYLPHAKLWGFPSFYTFVTLCTSLRSYQMNNFNALAVAGSALAKKFKVWSEEAVVFLYSGITILIMFNNEVCLSIYGREEV
jgi:hypothetical protein